MDKFIISFVFLVFIASMISLYKYWHSWDTTGTHDNYLEHLAWGWVSGMTFCVSGLSLMLIVGSFVYQWVTK